MPTPAEPDGSPDGSPLMRTPRFRLFLVIFALLVSAAVAVVPALAFLRAAGLLARASGMRGEWPERLARFDAAAFDITDLAVPTRYGALRARLYAPRRPFTRTIVMTPGVHMDGIDEPRLAKFARDFAASGFAVLTPELPELLEYRFTSRLTDYIEDAVRFAAANRRLARDGRVGLVGISFSGGLSVVAAGRPSIRDRVAFVMSFGGHGDLPRTVKYLCTGIQPDGALRPPHDYGVVVILLNAAPFLVPPDQVAGLDEGILTFLRASSIDMYDKPRAQAEFDRAIALATILPEPSATLLRKVNARDVKGLGQVLLPLVDAWAGDPALSPVDSPAPRAPVLLLHGADDNVIPSIESRWLGTHLARQGTPTRVLITPLITHAEIDRPPSPREVLQMVRFWMALVGG